MCQIWPAYEEYQTKTDRPIPVVVLDPVPPTGPDRRCRRRPPAFDRRPGSYLILIFG